jgi:hypothetical protein
MRLANKAISAARPATRASDAGVAFFLSTLHCVCAVSIGISGRGLRVVPDSYRVVGAACCVLRSMLVVVAEQQLTAASGDGRR